MNATLPVRYEVMRELRLGRRRFCILRDVHPTTEKKYGRLDAVTKEWKLVYTIEPKR